MEGGEFVSYSSGWALFRVGGKVMSHSHSVCRRVCASVEWVGEEEDDG